MTTKHNLKPKPAFIERMKTLFGNEKDFNDYMEILKEEPVRSIRCNTLKISEDELKNRLEKKGWKIKQPFKSNPEIMIVENVLEPGELGRSLEHLLGYYYVQEISSMLPIIALEPKRGDKFLDLCASPGSKTTQAAAKMENSGFIIANEISLGRIKILASNLERCGVANTIITRKDGEVMCRRLKQKNILFDKILVDAPCSGEGTLRSSPKTYKMWNPKNIISLSRIQKRLLSSAIEILKVGGEMIYSTCTHAPEENEEVLDYVLKKYEGQIKLEKINLPFNPRRGILKWRDKEYLEEVKFACRIYPHDNNTEGFFLAKIKKIK